MYGRNKKSLQKQKMYTRKLLLYIYTGDRRRRVEGKGFQVEEN